MTMESTRVSSGEPDIGERQRAIRARYLGGIRPGCDDHDVGARCGERAARFHRCGGTVSRDPQRVRWPLRPRLIAREREAAEPVDGGPVFDDREIDVESRSTIVELDDSRVEGEARTEHDLLAPAS